MKKLIGDHPIGVGISLIILILLLFSLPTYLLAVDPNKNFETNFIYFVGTLIISTLVLLIGYVQSQAALAQSKTNYLLRIDERWSSPEIIRAREVIHEFYLYAKQENGNLTQESLNFVIGQQILAISKINNSKKIKEFISLLNFLDFLETIGYMYSIRSLEIKDIQELSGNSILYFYKIFEAYIIYRRQKDPLFYKMFEHLYLDLRTYCNKKTTKSQ